jgi:hypothetical protein
LRCVLATSTPSGTLRGVPAIAFAILFAFLLLASAGARAVTPGAASLGIILVARRRRA